MRDQAYVRPRRGSERLCLPDAGARLVTMSDSRLIESVELTYRLYFAERESLLDPRAKRALAEAPRVWSLLVEMVIDDSMRRRGRLPNEYEMGLVDLYCALVDGRRDRALELLDQVTGKSWSHEAKEIALRVGADPEDAAAGVIGVLWDFFVDLGDHPREA